MAYKDSDELKSDERYPLGDYSFRIERTSVPGSTNDKIEAVCTQGGKNARKSIQVPSSTQLAGWWVEANEDTADVYITTEEVKGNNIPYANGGGTCVFLDGTRTVDSVPGDVKSFTRNGMNYWIRSGPFTLHIDFYDKQGIKTGSDDYTAASTTIRGKPVYRVNFAHITVASDYKPESFGPMTTDDFYVLVYGAIPSEQILVGRFAIDLKDAGGVGPGSDWIDPGDYDPEWEPEDPTHTLYIEVTGALSGRHNDPIVDPSYSYIPADKDTVKEYGCGGDGGHGGGGGAGASTVVIHKFATNQANSKEVTAIARRHGYGSGGGKGGKGGDGCILVYY